MQSIPQNVSGAIGRIKRYWRGEDFDKIYPFNWFGYGAISDMELISRWLIDQPEFSNIPEDHSQTPCQSP